MLMLKLQRVRGYLEKIYYTWKNMSNFLYFEQETFSILFFVLDFHSAKNGKFKLKKKNHMQYKYFILALRNILFYFILKVWEFWEMENGSMIAHKHRLVYFN